MCIYLHGYCESGDKGFLEKVEEMSEALLSEQTTKSDGTLFFSCGFNHNILTEYMRVAPWFSGMSQGTGLTAYTKLYELTKERKYRRIADRVW